MLKPTSGTYMTASLHVHYIEIYIVYVWSVSKDGVIRGSLLYLHYVTL